ncbi:lysozyme inhibitor LprI family protein [Microbaculum sp. FT89]|uniref:lysozyme inhibitor LprI family protein n=1 Tax=Microbaculum sp. FT89 TaxID=3447298 RepID=UPI003F5388B8
MLRNAILAALAMVAVGIGATGASAQEQTQAEDTMTLVAGTVDCRYQLRPIETAICTAPVLAAMDLQMITLYNVLNALVKPETGVEMAATQQAFLKSREACTSDPECIGQAIARRIGELDVILKDIASRGPY